MPSNRKPSTDQATKREPPPPRVGPLRTLADVQTELARVYRQARTRKISLEEAKGLGYLLQLLATITKDATIETRVAELEERLNAVASNPKA